MWLFLLVGCTDLQAYITDNMSPEYEVQELVVESREIKLHKVLEGFPELTDIQFLPSRKGLALITQKNGRLSLVDLSKNTEPKLLGEIPVRTQSELGLLSVGIPKDFDKKGLIYLHLNPEGGDRRTELSEWFLDIEKPHLERKQIIFQTPQPYANHDGGQILFDGQGHLYLGLGDGGWRNDPLDAGQDKTSELGTILRFKLDEKDFIPPDNPFLHEKGKSPYIWVYGLRNPWKFSFLPDGRLIIADVGQNKYEEISIAEKGDNLGWNIKEGKHCFAKDPCEMKNLVDPIFEYDHNIGSSITGGYVIQDGSKLDGSYIFGDFVTGRIWALDLKTETAEELLSSGMNISTFGRNEKGEIFVADYGRGDIYRLGY